MAVQLVECMARRTLQASPSFVEALVDATVLARAEGRVLQCRNIQKEIWHIPRALEHKEAVVTEA